MIFLLICVTEKNGERMQIDANDWFAQIDSAHLFENTSFTIKERWVIRDEGKLDYT